MMRATAHKVASACGRRCFSAAASGAHAHALPPLPSDAWAATHLSPAVAFLLRSGSYAPSSVRGTGRAGRILKEDVLRAIKDGSIKKEAAGAHGHGAAASSSAAAGAPSAAAAASATSLRRDRTHTDIPLSNVRKVIASRLSASKQQIPHAYTSATLRMDAVLKLRAALKDAGHDSVPSVNDFIVRASALALRALPAVNSTYSASTGATPSPTVDISVAVATPTGLITPIVKRADTKRLSTIGAEVKELAAKAKANKLKPDEFQGGSFTISNLGMFGINSFSAIINPPQCCILAVGGSVQRVDESKLDAEALAKLKPVETAAPAKAAAPAPAAAAASSPSLPFVHSSAFAAPAPAAPAAAAAKPVLRLPTSTFMTVTLVSDERAVDGEAAAQWLGLFKGFMENPTSMQ